MKTRLQQAGLWDRNSDGPEVDISAAWRILARVGLPSRYGGKAQDGSYEYMIIDPRTGRFLATGKSKTLVGSICEAALNARSLDVVNNQRA